MKYYECEIENANLNERAMLCLCHVNLFEKHQRCWVPDRIVVCQVNKIPLEYIC